MGKMKNEDIKELNEMPRFDTSDLEAWVIKASAILYSEDSVWRGAEGVPNEIIDRLRRLDVLKHDLDVVVSSLNTGV